MIVGVLILSFGDRYGIVRGRDPMCWTAKVVSAKRMATCLQLARAKEAFHEANRRIRSYQLIVLVRERARGGIGAQ